ncbi:MULTISPECIES: DUF6114 domain-containing protein [unclassified Brevibacterium]|uniref:DUF6114 domain-containing protein n=1 Tax=unclassified Brevibacterium TaxID=2614124 RepID=UPI001E581773|nr:MULTISPECIES: DUF6114 domain-containing protein [unclassified Brevibacterium]MDK8433639.1 DUF6114 domain-containing protein [Brevibacterium sp. H-BE7]
MKDAPTNGHAAGDPETTAPEAAAQDTTAQQTSLLALSRRSRRSGEHSTPENTQPENSQPESDVETAEFDAATTGADASTTESGAADAATSRRDRAAADHDESKRQGFRHWRLQRPFIGGLLVVLGGIELFFSGQLDTGNLHIQFGIEGLQATIIPIALVALGLSAMFRPTHHMFYGIIALVLAVYSLIGVNLGGFILGMLLSTIGAILVVAWMGPREPKPKKRKSKKASDAGRRDDAESADSAGQERNV